LLVRLRNLDGELSSRSATLPRTGLRRTLFDVATFLRMVRILGSGLNLSRIFGRRPFINATRALVDLVRGKKIDRILDERTRFKNVLTMLTIPYEDKGGLENARLADCPAVFAYEDVRTGRIRTTAFCSWQTVKDVVCREIQAKYDRKILEPEAPPCTMAPQNSARSHH